MPARLTTWLLLAFLAGNVNAGGYLACHRFVTHVTGFATLFGIDVATGAWAHALGILSVPAFFLAGAMLSAFFIDAAEARGKRPRYGLVLGLVAALLALAAGAGHLEAFGLFGAMFDLERDYLLLVLLCLASGLQNAAISTGSGMVVRTTHLTGMTTDLGTGLVRLAFGKLGSEAFRGEARRVGLRVGTIASFGAGGVTGAALFLRVKYLGFLLPCAIAAYAGIVATRAAKRSWRAPAGGGEDLHAA